MRNAKRSVFMPKIINVEREAFRVYDCVKLIYIYMISCARMQNC